MKEWVEKNSSTSAIKIRLRVKESKPTQFLKRWLQMLKMTVWAPSSQAKVTLKYNCRHEGIDSSTSKIRLRIKNLYPSSSLYQLSFLSHFPNLTISLFPVFLSLFPSPSSSLFLSVQCVIDAWNNLNKIEVNPSWKICSLWHSKQYWCYIKIKSIKTSRFSH